MKPLVALLLVCVATAQSPTAPAATGSGAPSEEFARSLDEARRLVRREDPVLALQSWRHLAALAPGDAQVLIGMGRTHLMLGAPQLAVLYAEAAVARFPTHSGSHTLLVDSLLRARQFDLALQRAREAVAAIEHPDAALLASFASALFRMQLHEEATVAYRRVLELEPRHAEAHLRLGSGLLPPAELVVGTELREAIVAEKAQDRQRSQRLLLGILDACPDHSIAHRLLGESLLADEATQSMAAVAAEFSELAGCLPRPTLDGLPVGLFLPAASGLSPARREVAARTLAMFSGYLDRLVAMGGRHDLLLEAERTTDAASRASLRGKRTFDGRVWDDVRGMGGLQAATGIESLDEAAGFGFDTLAHEVAHQVHLYVMNAAERRQIRDLYRKALEQGTCLDYYAASNEAEYLAQGVEAFASFGKRPGRESTHGHSRFELLRVDPELYEFVAKVVSQDPLRDATRRNALLGASVRVALRAGKAADARLGAGLMDDGPEKDDLLTQAMRAVLRARVS